MTRDRHVGTARAVFSKGNAAGARLCRALGSCGVFKRYGEKERGGAAEAHAGKTKEEKKGSLGQRKQTTIHAEAKKKKRKGAEKATPGVESEAPGGAES